MTSVTFFEIGKMRKTFAVLEKKATFYRPVYKICKISVSDVNVELCYIITMVSRLLYDRSKPQSKPKL